MAIVQAKFGFRLVDQQGVNASLSMPLNIVDTSTVAAVNTAWAAQAALLDAVTAAQIIGGSAVLVQAGAGKSSPTADGRVQEVGTLDFANGVTPYVYGSIIPAISDSVLLAPNDQQIDEANTAMAAYITSITAAVLGGHFTNHAYQNLTALVETFLSDRKHRRVLRARSLRRP